jgi:hypothetical protein
MTFIFDATTTESDDELTSFKSSLSSATARSNLGKSMTKKWWKSKPEGTKRPLLPPQNFENSFTEVSQ